MDSWLLKLLSRDLKTKRKKRSNTTVIKNNRKIKSDKKVKAMGNRKLFTDNYPRNSWEIPILYLICPFNPSNDLSITWLKGCIRIHS